MTDLPSDASLDYGAGDPGGDWTAAVLQFTRAMRQLPGLAVSSELTISLGSVTPTQGIHTVDTEGDAAADDLATIAQDNLPDGWPLLISCVDAARVVTVKHGGGGAGQILLVDSADLVLDDPNKWLELRRSGTTWVEAGRSYGADMAALRTWLGLQAGATLKHNLAATAAPTANDDSAAGYSVGSRWVDVSADKEYVCLDVTATAAVWTETTAGGSHTHTLSEITDAGTAAGKNTGTAAGDVVEVQTGGKLPALDGSQLTNLPSGGGGLYASVQVFTAGGTWTKPAGITKVKVFVTGGGGGPAGGNLGGENGQAGGTAIEVIDVSAVSSVAVTVGTKGALPGGDNAPGGDGGDSSFGTYCTGEGGRGGGTGNPLGTGLGGDINITGGENTYGSSSIWGSKFAWGGSYTDGVVVVEEYE